MSESEPKSVQDRLDELISSGGAVERDADEPGVLIWKVNEARGEEIQFFRIGREDAVLYALSDKPRDTRKPDAVELAAFAISAAAEPNLENEPRVRRLAYFALRSTDARIDIEGNIIDQELELLAHKMKGLIYYLSPARDGRDRK